MNLLYINVVRDGECVSVQLIPRASFAELQMRKCAGGSTNGLIRHSILHPQYQRAEVHQHMDHQKTA